MKQLLCITMISLLFSCASERPTPCECLELASDLLSKMAAGEMTEEEANAQASACSYMDGFSEEELAEKLVNCDFSDLEDAANEGIKQGLEESLSEDACACMDRLAAVQSNFLTIDTTDDAAMDEQIALLDEIEKDCNWLDEMGEEDLQTLLKNCPQYLEGL